MFCSFFFFSSRRRHTRFDCDWSSDVCSSDLPPRPMSPPPPGVVRPAVAAPPPRSEEHTSELQSQSNLVCRLLLEKKKHQPPLDPKARIATLQSAPTDPLPPPLAGRHCTPTRT